jgi:hypothetical protein
MNGSAMIDNLWRDVRFSLRTMLRKRAATAITLLTIALGIGATTAIFSLVNAVLFSRCRTRSRRRSSAYGTRVPLQAARSTTSACRHRCT